MTSDSSTRAPLNLDDCSVQLRYTLWSSLDRVAGPYKRPTVSNEWTVDAGFSIENLSYREYSLDGRVLVALILAHSTLTDTLPIKTLYIQKLTCPVKLIR